MKSRYQASGQIEGIQLGAVWREVGLRWISQACSSFGGVVRRQEMARVWFDVADKRGFPSACTACSAGGRVIEPLEATSPSLWKKKRPY